MVLAPARAVDVFQDRADAADSTTEPSEREVETTLQLFFKAAV